MMCCGCGVLSNEPGSTGVLIKKTETRTGKKSGLPVLHAVEFTDGSQEKYVCTSCFLQTEAARVVGEYDQGHDIPPDDYEVSYDEKPMRRMPPTFRGWG